MTVTDTPVRCFLVRERTSAVLSSRRSALGLVVAAAPARDSQHCPYSLLSLRAHRRGIPMPTHARHFLSRTLLQAVSRHVGGSLLLQYPNRTELAGIYDLRS